MFPDSQPQKGPAGWSGPVSRWPKAVQTPGFPDYPQPHPFSSSPRVYTKETRRESFWAPHPLVSSPLSSPASALGKTGPAPLLSWKKGEKSTIWLPFIPNPGLLANQGKAGGPGRQVLPGCGLGIRGRMGWQKEQGSRKGREERLGPVPGLTPGARSWTFCPVRCGACPWRTAWRERSHGEADGWGMGPSEPGHPMPTRWPRSPLPCSVGNHWEGKVRRVEKFDI